MRTAYRALAYLLAGLVLVQAAAIAYAITALGYWVAEDGGVLDKALMESDDADFGGITGFMVHGINGMMVIPLITLVLLVVSFFVKRAGATRQAAILLGLVVVQVALGIASHSLPYAIVLHALNAFAIFAVAALAGLRAGAPGAAEPAAAPHTASV
jgi:heme A synthase